MKKKIRARIIHPDAHVEIKWVPLGEVFTHKGKAYNRPGPNCIAYETICGVDVRTATWKWGVPNALPYMVETPKGLSGDDFQDLLGDWILRLWRRALTEKGAQTVREILAIIFAGIAAAGVMYLIYKTHGIEGLLREILE